MRLHDLTLILAVLLLASSSFAGVVPLGQVCSSMGVPEGGLVCMVQDAGVTMTQPLTADVGPLSSAQTLLIQYLSGSVNLNPMWADFWFNPDGSLLYPNSEEDWSVGSMNYNYLRPLAEDYPKDAGGDGINHFAGGGTNFDKYPSIDCAWGFWQHNLTTDTTVPGVVRFGSLVGTLDDGRNWFFIGYGKTIGAGTDTPIPDGATLRLGVMDANYGQNSGTYEVGVSAATPEPAVFVMVGAGLAGIALLRRRPNWHEREKL